MSNTPKELEPVLAEISAVTELGRSQWFEVVYFADGGWHSYAGSDTFENGEIVLRWRCAVECFLT